MLSAIHLSLNTCRDAEECTCHSLLTLLAAMIKHELYCCFLVPLGHISLEIQSLWQLCLHLEDHLCFPLLAKVIIAFAESYLDLQSRKGRPHLGAGGLFVGPILVVWGLLQQVSSQDRF